MRILWTIVVAVMVGAAPGPARAAGSEPQPPAQASSEQAQPPAANQREVQMWFDAMVVVQAQKALGLSDAQYPQFVGRLKALQDARRRGAAARNGLIAELNRLTNAGVTTIDEARVREKLKALDDVQARTAAEVGKAYDDLDQVLDLRQQARFRVFEEQVERRKFEFLLNARRRRAGTR